jgi:hypothetical protein
VLKVIRFGRNGDGINPVSSSDGTIEGRFFSGVKGHSAFERLCGLKQKEGTGE